ncbi:hypothetical protein HRbin33_01631 [bacterium HR33]|nr:hypothetical protein HRbin33_01631 [bacterium HR33]
MKRTVALAAGSVAALLWLSVPGSSQAQGLPRPADVFGFEPGADYMVADYDQMIEYYRRLDAASDRVQMIEIGRSARGKPMYLVIVSSEENMRDLERWRSISERLALARIGEEEARRLAREGRAVVWIDGGLDDQELATGQLMPELIYRVAAEESDEMRKIRSNVIALLMPHMNPEAAANDISWYRAQRGTPFEITDPPRLGQPYVGTDNNRDWFMITQPETWAASRIFYHVWHPQIVYNHHQTGPAYTRIVIPPYADPVNPDIHPGVTAWVNMVGAAMASRYASKHMPGYVSRVIYDMWWNGGMRLSPYYHNIVGILTETSHAWPTPYRYDTTAWPEVIAARKGDIPRTDRTSIFYAYPWKSAESHFRDAIDYMYEASIAVLNLAANYREELLFNRWRTGRDAIEAGERGNPYAYVLPRDQWDPSAARELVNVFRKGGVEVHRATQSFRAGGREYPAGSYVIYTAQAFRPLIMNLMEPQRYPDRRLYLGGPPEPPYDLSGWTLSMQMGAEVVRIDERFSASTEPIRDTLVPSGEVRGTAGYGWALSRKANASVKAVNLLLAQGERVYWAASGFSDGNNRYEAGTFVVERRGGTTERRVRDAAQQAGVDFVALGGRPGAELRPVRLPRVGLYKSWIPVDDMGWTLWILEQYAFPVDTLHNRDIQTGDLRRYDVILLPDQPAEQILNGHAPGTMPEEYVGGLGAAGVAALDRYVRNGGTIVAFDDASDFVAEQLSLPVRNAVAGVSTDNFFIPGSLVRATIEVNHPLAHGMKPEVAAFFRRSRAFEIVRLSRNREGGRVETPPGPEPPVEIVARYARENILMSGWGIGQERYLAGRPAMVRVRHGNGQAILFGFQPQFRSQPRGTYKLIFNSLYSATVPGM